MTDDPVAGTLHPLYPLHPLHPLHPTPWQAYTLAIYFSVGHLTGLGSDDGDDFLIDEDEGSMDGVVEDSYE